MRVLVESVAIKRGFAGFAFFAIDLRWMRWLMVIAAKANDRGLDGSVLNNRAERLRRST